MRFNFASEIDRMEAAAAIEIDSTLATSLSLSLSLIYYQRILERCIIGLTATALGESPRDRCQARVK